MASRVSGRRSAEEVLDQIKGKPVIGPNVSPSSRFTLTTTTAGA
jgi:hypothetical protein